jgi:2-(1,2-epoxy-1,2-dihydrophenyl)acetyl-CoA isomerase
METLQFDNVTLSFDGQLGVVTLDDPERLNAVSPAMADGVMRALQEASKPRRAVRALYITGQGRGFCAGANIAGRGAEGASNLPVLSRAESVYHPLIRRLRDFDRPIVAGVNGLCVGIGLAMILQADYVVAADAAYFSTPFAKLGSGPDGGLTWMLPRVVGPLRARRVLMMLERVPAEEAKAWGLVSEVLPTEGFEAAAKAVAQRFAAGPTVALSEMRRLLMDAQRADFDAHLEAEARALARTFRSKDNQAGMRAFATKAEATFTGE